DGSKRRATELIVGYVTPKWREVKALIRDGIEKDAEAVAVGKAAVLEKAGGTVDSMLLVGAIALVVALIVTFVATQNFLKPINRLQTIASEAALGKLDVNAESDREDEIGDLTRAIGDMVEAQREKAAAARDLADGNLTRVTPKSGSDGLAIAFNEQIDAIDGLMKEILRLAEAAREGRLAERGDAKKYNGAWREMVEGFNAALDAVILPIQESARALNLLAEGNLDAKATGDYQGDHRLVADSVNSLSDSLTNLTHEIGRLTLAAVQGRLNTRGNAEAFKGGYRELVAGVNQTLERLVGLLDEMPTPAMIIDNDFNIQFMNQAGAKLDGKLGAELIGEKCFNHFDTKDCNTENCACFQSMRRRGNVERETEAKPGGKALDINYSAVPMMDDAGEVIGAFEIVVDQTEIKAAMRRTEKVGAYQAREAEKLTRALERVAVGDLDVMIDVDEGDDDTREARESFAAIAEAVDQTVDAMKGVAETANKIAEGDFRVTIDVRSNEDELMLAMQDMVDRVSAALREVGSVSDQIAIGGGQLSAASETMAQGATEQAASLEEVSSSINEFSSQTKMNAENANEASSIAKQATEASQKGDEDMQTLTKAMGEITESSRNISQIIKTIDEIAFQTNLLALNAAVEAARAGAHGKGFAVVAEEVRNLAARSAKAAKETADMIELAIARAENGAESVGQAAERLKEILQGSERTSAILIEIAAASNEQAAGINQINTGLSQIDKVTQQNTAHAEQSASSAQELARQADALQEALDQFKLLDVEGARHIASRTVGAAPQPKRVEAPTRPRHEPRTLAAAPDEDDEAWDGDRSDSNEMPNPNEEEDEA
ncbi:MAG: HAMP domain-containing protein, partial [Ignavibacteriales bacterium]|nr:HAMP domain-containing protein [Ignavibacteriales bacterium]